MTDTNTPRVSVIMPAYNAGKYISEAIESIWLQGVENIQVIVVDDGSTDNTPEVLAGPLGNGIELVRTENQGVAKARNEGLDRATGKYIAFLDADDRWRPGKLQRELQLLDAEPDLGVVFSNFVRFEGSGTLYPDQFQFCPELDLLDTQATLAGDGCRIQGPAFIAAVGMAEVPGYTQTMVFRRSVIEDLRFRYPLDWSQGYQYLEDMDFCLRAFHRAPVAFIREPQVEIRRHGENLTHDYNRLAVAKLLTLRTLASEDLSDAESQALRDRTARQWVGAGRYYARAREPFKALHAYFKGFTLGRWKSAVAGVIRLPGDMIRGLD